MQIPLKKVLLQPNELRDAKPFVGFDVGTDLYHVLLFPQGADGGAIGVMRDGDDFCARITLDSLAAFNREAAALHIEGNA